MTTPRKVFFSVMLNSPSLLRIPTGRRETMPNWLFTKRDEFALGITEDKSI